MAGEMLRGGGRVRLDWSGPEHYDPHRRLPCRCCGQATNMRDSSGRPCHQECAEAELAAELYGDAVGERFPAAGDVAGEVRR